MDKKIFEFFDRALNQVQAEGQYAVDELSDLQLALVGGGIGDTVLAH